MAGYVPLPAYRNPQNALDFEPLNNAVQNWGATTRQNALDTYKVGQDQKQDARAGAAAGREAERFTMQKDEYNREKQAALVKNLAGVAQLVEQEKDPAVRQQNWGRLVSSHPSIAANLQKYGVDPSDHMRGPQFILAEARGYQDPMAQQKVQADINKTNAEASWYQERPRTMAGGATSTLISQLQAENPGMSLEQAITIAKRGTGVMEVGDTLRDRNTGATVSDIAPAIAGAERARVTGKAGGESEASLASLRSKMPGLESVVKELDALSEKATYTTTGKAIDLARREMGSEPRESSIARQRYIAMVDNQVLPMLRDTFGAAFTQKEGDSLKATLGAPDASPKEKQAVLKSFIEQKRRNIEAVAAEAGASHAAPSGGFKYLGPAP
jgi:hypothetical protein